MTHPTIRTLACSLALSFSAQLICLAADLPKAESIAPGVLMLMDDSGNWGGSSMGTTHQHQPSYQAMKVINLSSVPPDALKRAKEARLRVYFAMQDWSWQATGVANGLDESFELIVNGKVHTYRTDAGFIAKAHRDEPMRWAWQEFIIPITELLTGENRFIFKKAAGPKFDDYIYVGIDNTVHHGNSFMSNDGGKTWSDKALNSLKATGEYMVRLVLIEKDLSARAMWKPGTEPRPHDPAQIIGYASLERARQTTDGLILDGPDSYACLELNAGILDRWSPLQAIVDAAGPQPPRLEWLDDDAKPLRAKTTKTGTLLTSVPLPSRVRPAQLVLRGLEGAQILLRSVQLDASLAYLPEPVINICPRISPPVGAPANRITRCAIQGKEISLETPTLRCRFTADEHLRLASLYNEYSASEMLRDPSVSPLFLIQITDRRYQGAKDFTCRTTRSLADHKQGFTADLFLPEHSLRADLTVSVASEQMRWGLSLTNEGPKPLDFKLAFPVLAGLALSDDPAADYYFFPRGGGIIADVPAILQWGYGDHAALYQVMDIFSPSRGAGLLLRADDSDGRYKVLALRKFLPGKPTVVSELATTPTSNDFKWVVPSVMPSEASPPDAVPGLTLAFEYLRRTREPGKSFAPADAVFEAHWGDWHEAMRRYAAWAHSVWKFRPYPSRLDSVVNILAAGWGQGFLFKDGQYRTDFMKPGTDCIELMSWWDWSPLGPWSTPFDKLKDVLGESLYKRWSPYFVKDPVTGQMMWNNQPGDYDGYNERFGGLPAFQKAIQTYKDMGALVTLYTDPFRMDDASKVGQKYGKLWDVIKDDGEYSKSYEVWNPCHDLPEVRQWVADTMKRVMRETGADGIRLDEYGHRGWACFSKSHKHTFAEPGCTEWQRAVAETTKMVHAAMDEVDPKLILTTEHPGYDYLMQFIDGCITYDLTVQASELRPLECNIQRFYFPECKAYELDHRRADLKHEKRFWNAVASFGAYYPPPMYAIMKENNDAFRSRDCEPLVPTLVERVYANRFATAEKTIWTLYNARGFTVEAPLLEVPAAPNAHYFDLLQCKELPLVKSGDKPALALKLPRNRTACIARLPRLLSIRRAPNALEVTVTPQGEKLLLTLASQDGNVLIQREARAGINVLALPPSDQNAPPPACVKLLKEGFLLDAVELPAP